MEGEATIVGGIWSQEGIWSAVREETGRLSPPESVDAFRISAVVTVDGIPLEYLLTADLVFLGCGHNNCSLNNIFTRWTVSTSTV